MRINTLIVALFALIGLGGAVEKANAQIVLSVGIAPPALPVYVQPAIPAPDTSGRRVIGHGTRISQSITGCPEHG